MSEETTTVSNSLGDTPVIEPKTQEDVKNDSEVDTFFDSLDRELNDVTYDDFEVTKSEQATQPTQSEPPQQATHDNEQAVSTKEADMWENDSNPYKKRYSDSSSEAIRLKEQYKDVEPFVPVLEAMKNDSGLVDHVRGYLENGGAPAQSIQDKLSLDEDFIYDANEAVSEPESDSAKVMNAHVDSIVQQRINQVVANEKQEAMAASSKQKELVAEEEFRERRNMSQEDFNSMVETAKDHTLTLDDIYYVLNRDQTNSNVRNSTQKEMISQMRNVRNMPTSNSNANNTGENRTTEEQLFDSIFGEAAAEKSLFG
tara:strand:+ start:3862 stop:4800 length:939 start_codon:yes stop_codon:yes gene_type:complete